MSDHGCISDYTGPTGFDDELYYTELERQILQLTADDSEEVDGSKPFNSLPSGRASVARTSEASFVAVTGLSVASRVTSSCRVKSNGTGVFIPHAVRSRARNSPGTSMILQRRKFAIKGVWSIMFLSLIGHKRFFYRYTQRTRKEKSSIFSWLAHLS